MGVKVNIGIVGAGSFTDVWYLPILAKHPTVNLIAICSPSGISAQNLAEKYNIPASYNSYQEMLEKEVLDGICIITPNDSHHDIAVEASNHGIHVICEKPLAMDQIEALAMVKAAEENEIIHGVNFTYRENPGVKEMKKLVEEGFIGTILEGKFQYTAAYGLSGPPGWRGTKSIGGIGGVLADLGSHLIDLAQFVIGEEVNHVDASVSFLDNGRLKEIHEMEDNDQAADSVYFNALFPSGAHGSFHTSWINSQGNRNQTIGLTLAGTEGVIEFISSELGIQLKYAHKNQPWKSIDLGVKEWSDHAQPSESNFRPWRLTEQNEIWKWVDAIAARKEGKNTEIADLPNFNHGYSVQKVMDAVISSAKSRKKVSIE